MPDAPLIAHQPPRPLRQSLPPAPSPRPWRSPLPSSIIAPVPLHPPLERRARPHRHDDVPYQQATHFPVTGLRGDLQRALGDAYRLERELGGGGMSRVFVAEELRHEDAAHAAATQLA